MSDANLATLGGGCFWCLDAVYRELKGVSKVESGYAGGARPNPTYQEVCSGDTGHAEVVQITFDPSVVSYRDLLRVFFTVHDPTTRDRQGNDVGTQYRSVIFTHDDAQMADALAAKEEAQELYDAPIVTEITPLPAFYPGETYHQDYFTRNKFQPYCMFVIAPKVSKFRKQHLDKLQRA